MVELKPPPSLGFSGTAKFDINDPAAMAIVSELVTHRGYTVVKE